MNSAASGYFEGGGRGRRQFRTRLDDDGAGGGEAVGIGGDIVDGVERGWRDRCLLSLPSS